MMNCAECSEAVDAFIDGELTGEEQLEVREHLPACAECAAMVREREALSQAMRRSLPCHPAPDVLQARVRAALSNEVVAAAPAPPTRTAAPWTRRWAYLAAAAAGIAFVTVGVATVTIREREAGVADQVLSSHVRSLIPGHLTDVVSTNQHQVKPWFNGRIDLSPAVPNLDSTGYPLLGGRIDYVSGKNGAVVVYGRRGHVINVYSWAAESGDLAPLLVTRRGFHLIRSRRDGMEQWIVSDLNVAELQDFARRLAGS